MCVGVLSLPSEGQGRQGWILAMGLGNILELAHQLLGLKGSPGGHSRGGGGEQNPSPELRVCQGGPPGDLG